MKRTSLMTAALFSLLLVPAVQAQYPGNGNPGPYGNRPPSRDGNFYPDSAHMDRVSVLAHDIDNTARYIYKMARRNNRRPDQYEAQMLRDLYNLYGQADHFHAAAETYGQDPEHTADDFSALEEAFYQLGNTMQNVRPRSYIDSGMRRIYHSMNELSRYYGGEGYDSWGRYGQDQRNPNDQGHHDDHHDHNHDNNGYRPPQH